MLIQVIFEIRQLFKIIPITKGSRMLLLDLLVAIGSVLLQLSQESSKNLSLGWVRLNHLDLFDQQSSGCALDQQTEGSSACHIEQDELSSSLVFTLA